MNYRTVSLSGLGQMLIMRIIPGGGGGGSDPWKYYLLYLPSTGATYYSYGNLSDEQPICHQKLIYHTISSHSRNERDLLF